MSKLKLDLDALVNRQESSKTLVRFEDATDSLVPILRYNVPMPGSYDGFAYLEADFGGLPWTDEAYEGETKVPALSNAAKTPGLAKWLKEDPKHILTILTTPQVRPPIPSGPLVLASAIAEAPKSAMTSSLVALVERGNPDMFVSYAGHEVAIAEIEYEALRGRAPVLYYDFAGLPQHTFVHEAPDKASTAPRFVFVEHYRLSTHFGDYGAGRTIKTFSLWPGEETRLYVRSWRRTEARFKSASTIFDSYTDEAAQEFGTALEAENTDKVAFQKTKNWKVGGGFGLNLGFLKIGGGGGVQNSSVEARETLAKTVAKVSTHIASKASSKRETTIATELETTEAQEFESIEERRIANINLSRTLNVVCRELIQEFETYFSLVDITIAFANDKWIFEEVPLYEIDTLLAKYVRDRWDGNAPPSADVDPRKYVKDLIWKEIAHVYDFEGNPKKFVEEATAPNGHNYWRVRRRSSPDTPHPFYPEGDIPVDGIVLNCSRHSVRTDAIVIDALLGHGVALDNYALATQQEAIRERQIENLKAELAVELVKSGDDKKIELFKSIFVCCLDEPVKKIIERFSEAHKQSE